SAREIQRVGLRQTPARLVYPVAPVLVAGARWRARQEPVVGRVAARTRVAARLALAEGIAALLHLVAEDVVLPRKGRAAAIVNRAPQTPGTVGRVAEALLVRLRHVALVGELQQLVDGAVAAG